MRGAGGEYVEGALYLSMALSKDCQQHVLKSGAHKWRAPGIICLCPDSCEGHGSREQGLSHCFEILVTMKKDAEENSMERKVLWRL